MTAESREKVQTSSMAPLMEVNSICAYAAADLSGKPVIVCMSKIQRGDLGSKLCITENPNFNCPASLKVKMKVIELVKKYKKTK